MYFECVDCGNRSSYYRRHCPCCWSTLIDKVYPHKTLPPAAVQMIAAMTLVIATIDKKEEAKAK